MTLEILFAPKEERQYNETVTFICDNCNVKHYRVSGKGQTAAVQLLDVEGGFQKPLPGEMCDASSDHLITFDSVNPYTYLQKKIVVKNLTKVELPYNWLIIKPNLGPWPEGESYDSSPIERVHNQDTVFNISPHMGTLMPDALTSFVLTFAPPYVSDFHDVFHLVLRNIPKTGSYAHTNSEENSDLKLDQKESSSTDDITGIEIEAKGICEPLDVILQPYVVTIPGQTLVQTLIKRHIKMLNNSLSTIFFQWDHHSSDYILEVEPPIGELGPQCDVDLELSISGSKPCIISHTLKCNIQHMEEPIMLHVEAHIKGPEIAVEESDINFGLIQLGDTAQRTLTLRNTCRVPSRWKIEEANGLGEEKMKGTFTFMPPNGECRPLEDAVVTVTYKPSACQSLRTMFEIQVEDGSLSTIHVYAEVQIPHVCLQSSQLTMDDIYVGVPSQHKVTLINQTMLPTTFEFAQLRGRDAEACVITTDPSSGNLGPRQKLDIILHFTANKLGEISHIILPVHITGMEQTLFVAMFACVKDLQVSYHLKPSDFSVECMGTQHNEDLLLDFGSDVPVGDCIKRSFYMKNNSAIRANFSLGMEYFTSKTPAASLEKRQTRNIHLKSPKSLLLNRTQNMADPNSRDALQIKKDICKAMLKDGRGAAFDLFPASGVLEAFGEQKIEVTSYADVWGAYTDRIVCQVGNFEPFFIPIQLHVTGCPLHFQMVAAQQSKQPVLRLGTHVSGVSPIVRQMRINNTCPLDIRVDWQVFNKEDNDKQLVDMIVSYGDAFPLLDREGNEMIPQDQAPLVVCRQATDIIPNSPASSTRKTVEMDDVKSVDTAVKTEADAAPNLINVTLRPHGGKCSTHPYRIEPAQIIVPARGNTCINVSFTPLTNAEVTHEQDCFGFALGYLSLDSNNPSEQNKVTRPFGYKIPPLRLDMTACVKPALLTVEFEDEDGAIFRAAASDLLENGQVAQQCLKISRLTLSNHTSTNIDFRLLSVEPFHVIQLHKATRQPVAQLLQTDMTTLAPFQSAMMHVGFQVTQDLLSYTDTPPDGNDGVTCKTQDSETHVTFKQDLLVQFSNGTMQRIPLHGNLVLPAFNLSKESLDFGVCLVGQKRELQIVLSNPTTSGSIWICKQEHRSASATEDTFSVSPQNGALDAYITHASNSKIIIKIHFTAKHKEAYDAVFVFHGMLGEIPKRLYIKGEGSYDGKHETLVNT